MSEAKENPDRPASTNQGSQSEVNDRLKHAVMDNSTLKETTLQVCDKLASLRLSGHVPLYRIRECNSFLKFRNYYQIDTLKLSSANFCKVHQVCSQCARRRAMKYAKAIKDTVEILRGNHPESVFLFLTFTVRNGVHLPEAMKRLDQYMNTLMGRFKRQNVHESIMCKIYGGFYSIELTHNGTTWHPHVHMLVEASEVIDTLQVRKEWSEISNGDSYICDARPIQFTDDQSLFNACLEVSKYTLKNTSLSPEHLLEAYINLKGKNLVNRFGSFRGKKISLLPDLDKFADQPFWEYCFNWFNRKYHFNEKASNHYDNFADYKEKHHVKPSDDN
jgi:Replication protein